MPTPLPLVLRAVRELPDGAKQEQFHRFRDQHGDAYFVKIRLVMPCKFTRRYSNPGVNEKLFPGRQFPEFLAWQAAKVQPVKQFKFK